MQLVTEKSLWLFLGSHITSAIKLPFQKTFLKMLCISCSIYLKSTLNRWLVFQKHCLYIILLIYNIIIHPVRLFLDFNAELSDVAAACRAWGVTAVLWDHFCCGSPEGALTPAEQCDMTPKASGTKPTSAEEIQSHTHPAIIPN